jgi:DNA polymerase-1
VGFGLNYDQGPGALAKTLDIEVQEAKKLIELYFKPYPKVKQFIYNVHSYILDHAMVETILGRPRRFHELHEIGRRLDTITRWELPGSAKSNLAQAERQSVNSIIQGSMADVAKLAMLNCEHDLQLESLGVQMLLQIHDELVFEVPEENIEKSKPIIKQHMEHPLKKDLLVPLDIDMGTGYSWASAKG